MDTPKYYLLRRMRLTERELLAQINEYKFRLWQHIDLPSRCHKQNYIDYLERNIKELQQCMPLKKAA